MEKFIGNLADTQITRADEIAVLSCIHEGIYDFMHAVSHETALNLPREPETSAGGLPIEDRVILHRFGGVALCRMIKLRQNTIKGVKGTMKVTDRHKEELERELEVLLAMKMSDKSSLPSEIRDHLDEGGLYFLKEEFIDFVRVADNCTRRLTTERTFQRGPSSFLQFVFTSVYGNNAVFSVFKSSLDAVGINTKFAAVRKVYEQLLTKICRTRVKVFLQAMRERDLQKKKKVVDVSLRDKLKGFAVRTKRLSVSGEKWQEKQVQVLPLPHTHPLFWHLSFILLVPLIESLEQTTFSSSKIRSHNECCKSTKGNIYFLHYIKVVCNVAPTKLFI